MATIVELKNMIPDLHDLALHLGLVRPGSKGNYRSPHHDDKTPSLEIKNNGKWIDYSRGDDDARGDAIDLIEYVNGVDTVEAIKFLHSYLGVPMEKPKGQKPATASKAEWIAAQCRPDGVDWKKRAIDYLVKERAIDEEVAKRAVDKGAVGWNVWTSPKVAVGEFGHGGEAIAFFVRDFHNGRTVAVDMRYLDPELNGNVKTQSHGEKMGFPYFTDLSRLKNAHTVYIVESPINVLSVESCKMPGVAAIAIRGNARVVPTLNLSWLLGKKVVLCCDFDEPDKQGHCAGQEASWALNEQLNAMNIANHMVDQGEWVDPYYNDVNDILKAEGADNLKKMIKTQFEPWLIPGLPGDIDRRKGKARLFLPSHDFAKYWLFRIKEDFTQHISKIEKDDEDGSEKKTFSDLCGFRVANLSRVTIASATSTMTGDVDSSPRILFSVSVQTPRNGPRLVRRVFDDETLHNVELWKKFGPIFSPMNFSRMLTILERSAHLGGRDAINFVGLGWQNGKLTVNEGADAFFEDPKKQCPYHNLVFPSGSRSDAAPVIDAYQKTFGKNAALQMLTWSLGGHLKVLLGYYPHLMLQADKGSGKSTIIKRLERTIAMKMLSGQSLETPFRLLTSIGHTSHPIGWEEISARKQQTIDAAVSMLQENYQFTTTNRNSEMTEYLLSAPVLLAGEDVPVDSLIGKICRVTLKERGDLMPDELPKFPVRQWLDFLAGHTKQQIKQLHLANIEYCRKKSCATGEDTGASRMMENYAAILTSWALLTEFADIANNQGEFVNDLMAEMNDHIAETSGDREPWVWIVNILISEIASGKYRMPYKIDKDNETDQLQLSVLPSQVMHHIKTDAGLRDAWNALPVKSARVLKRQLIQSGVVLKEDASATIQGRRQTHMISLSAKKLAEYGLHVAEPTDVRSEVGP